MERIQSDPVLRPWGPSASTLGVGSNPMRIGLIGFGRTGRTVAVVLLRDPSVRLEWVVRRSVEPRGRRAAAVLGVESDDPGRLMSIVDVCGESLLRCYPVDAIIDFSSSSGLDFYERAAAEQGVAVVCAVARFENDPSGRFRLLGQSTRVLWSPNITIGVNVLLLAARCIQSLAPDADVAVVEEHFTGKREVSGTAVRIAEALDLSGGDVASIRVGGVLGVHEVVFGFPDQTVRLRHECISREAFAHGALSAVRRISGEPNGFYRMENIFLGDLVRAMAAELSLSSNVADPDTAAVGVVNR